MKKKILLVSDCITVFSGGIEMYIFNVSKLLRTQDFIVDTFGITWGKDFLKKVRGYLLPLTGFNLISAIGLIIRCARFAPDVLRFHSVNRFHGRLPVLMSGMFSSQKLMMYHDVGYFHPFPHLVTQEDQVLPWGIGNFIMMGLKAKGPQNFFSKTFVIALVVLKFFSIELLRLSLLLVIDKHLVPSEFMVVYLKKRGIDSAKIEVLPHFIINELGV